MFWLHLIFILAINAVPAVGVFAFGWSVGVLLILFWAENLAGVLIVALRLSLHERGTGGRARKVREFLSTALPFALAHGIFAIVLPWAFGQDRGGVDAALWLPRWEDLRTGAEIIVAIMLVDLLLDISGVARRDAAAIQALADARAVKVMALHLVIIFGAIAAGQFKSPYGMLAVMIALKTAIDVGSLWAGRARRSPVMHAGVVYPPTTLEQLEAEAERRLSADEKTQRDLSR